MELVKGQNISIASAQNLLIDIGWRSAVTDLNLQAYGIFFSSTKDKGELISTEHQQENILRSKDGRRFELNIASLDNTMNKFYILLVLPTDTKYTFNEVKNIQAFINSNDGIKIATVKLAEYRSDALSMNFLELYKHHDEWKVKLNAQSTNDDITAFSEALNFQLPNYLQTNQPIKINADKPAEINQHSLKEGITLNMGESFSLTEEYPHILHLSWKTRSTPALNDITLNAVALNNLNQVSSIEDFIYHSNPTLRGSAVQLNSSKSQGHAIEIDFEKLPQDIDKLCLIATRESDSKRFSSADFIQTKLESSNTSLPICNFTCETANKNYNCIILLEIYKHNSQWKVKAVGQGYAQGLKAIGEAYGFNPPRIRPISVHTANRVISPTTSSHSTQQNHTPTTTNNNLTSPAQQLIAPIQEISNKTGFWGISLAVIGLFILLGSSTNGSITALIISLAASLSCIVAGSFMVINARKQAKLVLLEENERFILNMIKHNNYQLTPFDVAAKCTLTVEQATKILDSLCDKGAGRLTINDNGSEIYTFEAMQSNSSSRSDNW